MKNNDPTQIYFLEENQGNQIYIMRDDLIPFSFGGNKVRKALLFFKEIDAAQYDTVVTYGSGSSNHCRIVANMASKREMRCVVISADDENNGINRHLVRGLFNAEVCTCTTGKVAQTIEQTLLELKKTGHNPYFIPGGGHGNIGTKAYDLAYDEIASYPIDFDYIFHASGTGTTQAGLICGKLRHGKLKQKIIGISIARKNPRGGQVIIDSVKDYIGKEPGEHLIFDDNYICDGYGRWDSKVSLVIQRVMNQHGLPLDPIYTGKAYAGMERYLHEHRVTGKKILFIHTGGTPIFCDWAMDL